MGNFINALGNEIDAKYNVSYTENGAKGFATTRHPLLDMNFKVASYRHMSEKEIVSDFAEALNENFELTIAWLFYVRDVRQGLGERRLFRVLFKELAQGHPATVTKLIKYIAEYGRYDDLLELLGTEVEKEVMSVIVNTLTSDMKNMEAKKPITLLAKWLPSINTSSKDSVAKAKIVAKALKLSSKEYRQMLSKLRAYLKVVEVNMSANDWDKINYEAVPSKANLVYKNAFLKHDEERRREFLSKLEKGEAKINSTTAFPHDIVHKYYSGRYGSMSSNVDATLEAMWKALPDMGIENTIVVADGSGSMNTVVDNSSSVRAIEVANALAIYCAERCKGPFKDNYITFSSRPQLVHLGGKTLLDNMKVAARHTEVANTNIEATFDLILRTAANNGLSQEELPKTILIISDMEFDMATCSSWGERFNTPSETLFNTIARKFAEKGYKLPRLVFWNVNSRTGTIPVKENDLGVALVSGFSTNVVKMVMSDIMDPWQLLVNTLVSARYAPILNEITE